MSRVPPSPYSASNWQDWANQMLEYIQDSSPSQAAVSPRPVFLEHKIPSVPASAATDGIMMYDPVSGEPVYSVNGEWEKMVTETALSDPFIGGSADIDLLILSGTWTDVPISNSTIPDPVTGSVYQVSVEVVVTGTSGGATAQFRWIWDTGTDTGGVINIGNNADVYLSTTQFVPAGANLRLQATGVSSTITGGKISINHVGYGSVAAD